MHPMRVPKRFSSFEKIVQNSSNTLNENHPIQDIDPKKLTIVSAGSFNNK